MTTSRFFTHCHYVEIGGQQLFIPLCTGGVQQGPDGCSCPEFVRRRHIALNIDTVLRERREALLPTQYGRERYERVRAAVQVLFRKYARD